MSDTKTIWVSLTDGWAIHELLRGISGPHVLGKDESEVHYLLRKVQDIILALTFPKGVTTTAAIAGYGAAAAPSADKQELALTFDDAWMIVSSLGRTSYDNAQPVLLQVFLVLQQFSGLVPELEPLTEVPPWAREIEEA
jgi:hypothetical protein